MLNELLLVRWVEMATYSTCVHCCLRHEGQLHATVGAQLELLPVLVHDNKICLWRFPDGEPLAPCG